MGKINQTEITINKFKYTLNLLLSEIFEDKKMKVNLHQINTYVDSQIFSEFTKAIQNFEEIDNHKIIYGYLIGKEIPYQNIICKYSEQLCKFILDLYYKEFPNSDYKQYFIDFEHIEDSQLKDGIRCILLNEKIQYTVEVIKIMLHRVYCDLMGDENKRNEFEKYFYSKINIHPIYYHIIDNHFKIMVVNEELIIRDQDEILNHRLSANKLPLTISEFNLKYNY